MARGMGHLQPFQDSARHLQDVAGPAWVLRDPWDGRHTKVHQDNRHVPHQGCQLPDLGNMHHLSLLKALLELDELDQLFMVFMGVEASSPPHQRFLLQSEDLLPLIEEDLLLPQHLVEDEGVVGTSDVCMHLCEVLLMSSLSFHLFSIEVSADLD
jgi:hypothetical protein